MRSTYVDPSPGVGSSGILERVTRRTDGDVAAFVLGAIRGLIESDRVGASLGVLDDAGRVRTVAAQGVPIGGSRTARSGRRRRVLRAGMPTIVTVPKNSTESIESIPLIDAGVPVGVMEVRAPTVALDAGREPLLMVAEQAARILRRQRDRRAAEPLGGFDGTMDLVQELMAGETPQEIVRRAVGCLHDRLGLPVAGWISSADGDAPDLVASRGLTGTVRASLIRVAMRSTTDPESPHVDLVSVFGSALGVTHVREMTAGRAVLLVGGVGERTPPLLEAVGVLLSEALIRVEIVNRARHREDALHTGLAWTAHEVRRSLEGIRIAVEAVRVVGDTDADGRRLLERARRELHQLSSDVDSVLRWSVGERAIRRRYNDLMRLVRDVVTATSGIGSDRFVIEGPSSIMVPADGANLRTAVANLLRNAVSYADTQRPAVIRIVPSADWVVLSVRDYGPGIPAEERESIFDPFVRGRSARGRTGNGLGLFVARRVAEAHGGAVWCESDRGGATFMLRLPLVIGGPSSTAS